MRKTLNEKDVLEYIYMHRERRERERKKEKKGRGDRESERVIYISGNPVKKFETQSFPSISNIYFFGGMHGPV